MIPLKHLRVKNAPTPLKAEQAWTSDDAPPPEDDPERAPHTKIFLMPSGHAVVRRFGKNIGIGAAQVDYFELYDPTPSQQSSEKAAKVK